MGPVRILAFDTSASACSVGLWQGEPGTGGGLVAVRHEARRHGHAEVLMPMISAVLAEAGHRLAMLDRIAVTVGPGAFTGLRIGLAAARGLALAGGLPLVGLTSLAVLAAGLPAAVPGLRLIAIDSRREELFVQLFAGDARVMSAPAMVRPEAVPALLPVDGAIIVAGDGAAVGWGGAPPPGLPAGPADPRSGRARPLCRGHDPGPGRGRPAVLSACARCDSGRWQRRIMTPLRLQSIGPWDGPVLSLIHDAGFAAQAWSADAFTRLLAGPGTGGLMALPPPAAAAPDGAPVAEPLGLVLWRHAADEAEILTLCTLPSARRIGVATALLNGMADRLRLLGIGAVFLEVAADNQAARALYGATGFAGVGRRRGYYRGPQGSVDAIVMRLPLAASAADFRWPNS
jgi:tRNA threonylcarbamoyladenosine biosynthesis protein TsaB